MFKLETLVQHIVGETGIPTRVALDKSPELRVGASDPAYALVAYDKIITPHEADVLADSASEIGNSLLSLTRVTLVARPEQYPEVWLGLYQACLHFQPVFPSPSHQPLSFTFVNCDFYEDGGLWIATSSWGHLFDRWWAGDVRSRDGEYFPYVCAPSALDPTGVYNPSTIGLP